MKSKRKKLWNQIIILTNQKGWERKDEIVAEVQEKVREYERLAPRKDKKDQKRSKNAYYYEVIKANGEKLVLSTRAKVSRELDVSLTTVDSATKLERATIDGHWIFKRKRQYQLYVDDEYIGTGSLKELAALTEYSYDVFLNKVYLEERYRVHEVDPI